MSDAPETIVILAVPLYYPFPSFILTPAKPWRNMFVFHFTLLFCGWQLLPFLSGSLCMF